MADITQKDLDFAATALRDGKQAARERHQAEVELEQGLIAQEQLLEAGTGVPIVEQADMGDDAHEDGRGVITASKDMNDHEGGGLTLSDPGAGTDPSESATSSGGAEPSVRDETPELELQGDERTFEGDGRHPLDEQ
ncbi:MAG: hypothetical protein JWO69_853 [Thermoleophilia bacterium]|jgi:hypothetical protein|nr:hypothetical protein [Thermoleophilia bacterium]